MALEILTSAPSVCRNAIKARDFSDASALRAHYAAVHARLWSPRPITHVIDVVAIPVTIAPELIVTELPPAPAQRQEPSADQIITPRDIIRRIAAEHGLTVDDIRGARRTRRNIEARRAAVAALLDVYPTASLAVLGRWLHKHHATVLHALRSLGRTTAGGARWGRELPPELLDEAPTVATGPTPRSIIADVARKHGILIREITGPSLAQPFVRARYEAMVAVADAFPAMRSADVTALFDREQSALRHARRMLVGHRAAHPATSEQEPRP